MNRVGGAIKIMFSWSQTIFSRVREWCGDAAYERYLRSNARRQSGNRALSAKEFYAEQIDRRYSQPNRCC